MIAPRVIALSLVLALSGCSLFRSDDPGTPKKTSLFGSGAPQDATGFLEYQRSRTGTDKSQYALSVRNTHPHKMIEGDIRTTIETGPGQSAVDNTHFTLAPDETKKLLVYPATTKLSYEVTATFKQ